MTRRHLIVFVLFASTCAFASKPKPAEADALIQRAIAHSDWRAAGPISVSGTVVLKAVKGNPTILYEMLWKSSREWRDSVSAPGYREERVALGDKLYLQRPASSSPGVFLDMYLALDPQRIWNGLPEHTPSKVFTRKIAGHPAICVHYTTKQFGIFGEPTFCADAATADLLYASSMLGDVTYSNFSNVDDRSFARNIEVKHNDVLELALALQANPSIAGPPLVAPSGAVTYVNCPAVDFREPLKDDAHSPPPHYPREARIRGEQGTSGYVVLISSTGVVEVKDLAVAATTLLDDQTRSVLPQWKYFPATCNGQPIDVETVIRVNYTLSAH